MPPTIPDLDDDMAAAAVEGPPPPAAAMDSIFSTVDFSKSPSEIRQRIEENWNEVLRKKSRHN